MQEILTERSQSIRVCKYLPTYTTSPNMAHKGGLSGEQPCIISILHSTRQSLVNVPQQFSNWFCCPYVWLKVDAIFSLHASYNFKPGNATFMIHLKLKLTRESDANRFLLVAWLKNGRHSTLSLTHESQVNKPAKNRFLLITRLKMATSSTITLFLSPRWISPTLFLLITWLNNGHHLHAFSHIWVPGDMSKPATSDHGAEKWPPVLFPQIWIPGE